MIQLWVWKCCIRDIKPQRWNCKMAPVLDTMMYWKSIVFVFWGNPGFAFSKSYTCFHPYNSTKINSFLRISILYESRKRYLKLNIAIIWNFIDFLTKFRLFANRRIWKNLVYNRTIFCFLIIVLQWLFQHEKCVLFIIVLYTIICF